MRPDSVIAFRPQFGMVANPYDLEARVRECVGWLHRVLKPVDEPFFYHMVEELLADQPEVVRLEAQSRIYQMIPRPPIEPALSDNLAWHLD
jgi:hypothetical protein